jgi:hypothetical protein
VRLPGNTLEVVKLTSLASVVALPELLYAARSAQSVTYNPSPIVLAAAHVFPVAVAPRAPALAPRAPHDRLAMTSPRVTGPGARRAAIDAIRACAPVPS